MAKKTFIEVYEVNLIFFNFHILIVVFPCDLKISTEYIDLGKRGILFKDDHRQSKIHNYLLEFLHLLWARYGKIKKNNKIL
jgi:hypothetical protein